MASGARRAGVDPVDRHLAASAGEGEVHLLRREERRRRLPGGRGQARYRCRDPQPRDHQRPHRHRYGWCAGERRAARIPDEN